MLYNMNKHMLLSYSCLCRATNESGSGALQLLVFVHFSCKYINLIMNNQDYLFSTMINHSI